MTFFAPAANCNSGIGVRGFGGDEHELHEPGTAPDHITRRDYHLILDAVPALICTQCGESYFDSHVVALIDKAIDALDTLDDSLRKVAKQSAAKETKTVV
jgi:YgiT-type zinc finger domain-containing protein